MTILFRPQGAFGWFSYTTSRDTISLLASLPLYGMQITAALLRDLVNAVVLFWLDMRIACTEALIPSNPAIVEEVARLQALRPALL
ncbi:hypothetical protein [Pseudomonas sp. B14(2017)]|uniref:hypothetical protein n=1 Tax=Pseudomonas sp. B14(2017) TaxID=1981745 RepID=UPI000A1FBA82|nr:hypothetical protein [Pseudomonas sp. B14(2017)]